MKTLYDIQTGDQVLVSSRYVQKICKVERVTPTQIICNNQKYRKSDGRLISKNPWYSEGIQILTPELKIEFYKKVALSKNIQLIKTTDWECMSEEVINQIADIIKQNQK